MININLLPEKFKKKNFAPKMVDFSVPKEIIIGISTGLFSLLIIIHLILLFFTLGAKFRFNALDKQWNKLKPQRQVIDAAKQEINSIESKIKSITSLRASKRISWSKKLNILSDSLVRGVWLTRIYFTAGVIKIEGAAVSKRDQEFINVSEFAANLKANKDFYSELSSMDLTYIQRRSIKSIEVVDFLITAAVKE